MLSSRRPVDRTTVMPQKDLLELPSTMNERRDEDATVLVNSECAQVEYLVMQ